MSPSSLIFAGRLANSDRPRCDAAHHHAFEHGLAPHGGIARCRQASLLDGRAHQFLRLRGRGGSASGTPPLGHSPLEALDPTTGVDQLLPAGVERMTGGADLDVDLGLRRAGHELVAARAAHMRIYIFRVYASFHSTFEFSGPPALPTRRISARKGVSLTRRGRRTRHRQRVVRVVVLVDALRRIDRHGQRGPGGARRRRRSACALSLRPDPRDRRRNGLPLPSANSTSTGPAPVRPAVRDHRGVGPFTGRRARSDRGDRQRAHEQVRTELGLVAGGARLGRRAERLALRPDPPEHAPGTCTSPARRAGRPGG